MSADLATRLNTLFSHFDETTIEEGLEPLSEGLMKQFTQNPTNGFVEKLYIFCRAYITMVPLQLDQLKLKSTDLKLEELVANYSNLASNFLTSACDEIDQSRHNQHLEQFLVLLQGAYIYGRMQEELDDKIQAFVGVPLGHLDLMEANLIVHEILGDSFANRLDKVAVSLIQQTKVSMKVIEANLDPAQIKSAKAGQLSLTGEKIENFSAQYGLSMLNALI